MGAEGWWYRVPATGDGRQALASLRQRVFESGEYTFEVDEELLGLLGELQEEVDTDDAAARSPSSIEEAVRWTAGFGTHSILDVERFAEPADDATMPGLVRWITPADTERLFGSDTPQCSQIEGDRDALFSLVPTYSAIAITGYKGRDPDSFFFVGVTGD